MDACISFVLVCCLVKLCMGYSAIFACAISDCCMLSTHCGTSLMMSSMMFSGLTPIEPKAREHKCAGPPCGNKITGAAAMRADR